MCGLTASVKVNKHPLFDKQYLWENALGSVGVAFVWGGGDLITVLLYSIYSNILLNCPDLSVFNKKHFPIWAFLSQWVTYGLFIAEAVAWFNFHWD